MLSSSCIPSAIHAAQFSDWQLGAQIRPLSFWTQEQPPAAPKLILVSLGDRPQQEGFRKALYALQAIFPSQAPFILDLGYLPQPQALSFLLEQPLVQNSCLLLVDPEEQAFPTLTKQLNGQRSSIIDQKLIYQEAQSSYLNELEIAGHLAFLGYQSHYCSKNSLIRLQEAGAWTQRLGLLQSQLSEIEPSFRESQLLLFRLNSLAQNGFLNPQSPEPNGWTNKEACQIMSYAGLSDNIQLVCLQNFRADYQAAPLAAKLLAQMCWYFCSAFKERLAEGIPPPQEMQRYALQLPQDNLPLSFYQSRRSGRWWFSLSREEEAPRLLACSERDYLLACKGQISERIFWSAQQL